MELSVSYIEAKDGQQALGMIVQKAIAVPDVIFLDLNMPKVGGYEVLVNVKQLYPYKAPIFMYTTSSNSFDKNKCMQVGAAGFVTKHDCFEDLCNELRFMVDKI